MSLRVPLDHGAVDPDPGPRKAVRVRAGCDPAAMSLAVYVRPPMDSPTWVTLDPVPVPLALYAQSFPNDPVREALDPPTLQLADSQQPRALDLANSKRS